MTDATIVALISGLPATLAALGALWVSIRNSAKADVIVGHVNSAATKAAGEISALRQEVELLRNFAAQNKETAALLAQAATKASTPLAMTMPMSVPSPLQAAPEPVQVEVVNTPLMTTDASKQKETP